MLRFARPGPAQLGDLVAVGVGIELVELPHGRLDGRGDRIEVAVRERDHRPIEGDLGKIGPGGSFNRTPRPPSRLVAPSAMSSIPAASRAAISFMRESTLPRTMSLLASMRWMVGRERPEISANSRWSMLSSARAARNCAELIIYALPLMRHASIIVDTTCLEISQPSHTARQPRLPVR